jgi:hypothetical protein
LKRAPKKIFQEMLARGGGWEKGKFSRRTIPKLHVFDHIFLKMWKFPNKPDTFDVNLVFTATLASTKRALFITKSFGKIGGGGHVHPVPPPVPTPLLRIFGTLLEWNRRQSHDCSELF